MEATLDSLGHLNAKDKIHKYRLGPTTLNSIDVDSFYNARCGTLFWFLVTWCLMFLSCVLLAADMYTCVMILAFGRWSSNEYKPYAYEVAKYIFTACIIFEFLLLFYHWIWAIKVIRSKNVALLYLTNLTRIMYTLRSYKYHCLFNAIDAEDSYDWCCLFAYSELDAAFQILIADTPRQVINFLTLRYYATGGDANNDVITNIKILASTNVKLSIVLSFMCLSVFIWTIFISKFLVGIILYLYIKPSLHKRGSRSLKKYCCSVANDSIRVLMLTHNRKRFRTKTSLQTLDTPPPVPSLVSTDTLIKEFSSNEPVLLDFKYRQAPMLAKPRPLRQAVSTRSFQSQPMEMQEFKDSKDTFSTGRDQVYATPPQSSRIPLGQNSISKLASREPDYIPLKSDSRDYSGLVQSIDSDLIDYPPAVGAPSYLLYQLRQNSQSDLFPGQNPQPNFYQLRQHSQSDFYHGQSPFGDQTGVTSPPTYRLNAPAQQPLMGNLLDRPITQQPLMGSLLDRPITQQSLLSNLLDRLQQSLTGELLDRSSTNHSLAGNLFGHQPQNNYTPPPRTSLRPRDDSSDDSSAPYPVRGVSVYKHGQ